ncbi:MAG: HD-GYP domain-containing protein [Porticoccaceae bacterium]
MAIKQVRVDIEDLTPGMFVSQLDRPWAQTPFPLEGFHIRSKQDIDTLRIYCAYAYIDVAKGRGLPAIAGARGRASSPSARSAGMEPIDPARRLNTRSVGKRDPFVPAPIVVRRGVYATSVALRAEVGEAKNVLAHLKGNLTLVAKQLARGKLADYDRLKLSVNAMVDSVLRCPDALTWLVRLRERDQHTHDHSLRSALWAVQFARFVGMDKAEINTLCMGVLLKDIGKVKLSNTLLRKQERTKEEMEEYRRFVEYGVEIVRQTREVEPRVISVVRYHCERHDGSGFPEGLLGSKIPLLARIAGIATVYDAICNPREAIEPVPPSRGVSLLYNMRDKEFQEDLVIKFIQSIGLYPTGTLVELTSGDIAVVVEQHPQSRLSPQVAVLDQRGGDLNRNIILVDLKDEEGARRTLLENGRDQVNELDRVAIARDLEPTGYDIDLAAIAALFMGQSAVVDGEDGLFCRLRRRFGGSKSSV